MIRFIKRAQHLGFTLDQIDEPLDLAVGRPDSVDSIRTVAEHHIADLNYAPKDIAGVGHRDGPRASRRVILAGGWAGPIDDAGDCFVVGEVNQQALFGRVAAVVHRGGAGTTTTAVRAGAPQVIVPHIADQPYWAARVAELGIGVAHEGSMPTVDSLSAALTLALASEIRARAWA